MSSVRFVADGMLGTLARKLRMFGYDTLYYNGMGDDDLLSIGRNEDRILLTCDKKLFQRALNNSIKSVLLEGSDDVSNMAHVLKSNGVRTTEFLPERSRCPLCNNILYKSDKEGIMQLIPPKVVESHDNFYFCKNCNKVYWEGSHLNKLQEFGKRVMRQIENAS